MNRHEFFTVLSDLSTGLDALHAEFQKILPRLEDVLTLRRDLPPPPVRGWDLMVSLIDPLAARVNIVLAAYDHLRECVRLAPLYEVCQMGIDAGWVTAARFWRERLRQLDPTYFAPDNH